MNLILGAMLLATGAWAAPIDPLPSVETEPADAAKVAHLAAHEEQIRNTYRQLGYPEEAISEFLELLDLDHVGTPGHFEAVNEKAMQWEAKCAPVLVNELRAKQEQLRAYLLTEGYSEDMVSQYPKIRDPHYDGRMDDEMKAAIQSWHDAFDPIVADARECAQLLEMGYPASAVSEYMDLMGRISREPWSDERMRRIFEMFEENEHLVAETRSRNELKADGWSDAAIEAHLAALALQHPVASAAEKAARADHWMEHLGEHQTRLSFRQIGHTEEAIREFELLSQSSPGVSDDDMKDRYDQWLRKWLPVLSLNNTRKFLVDGGYPAEAISEFTAIETSNDDAPTEVKKARAKAWSDKWEPIVQAKRKSIALSRE